MASRAREKRIHVGFDPRPLRTDAAPDGLADLSVEDKLRVEQASVLYAFTAEACLELDELGTAWSIKKPKEQFVLVHFLARQA